jgi:hypothetical protein
LGTLWRAELAALEPSKTLACWRTSASFQTASNTPLPGSFRKEVLLVTRESSAAEVAWQARWRAVRPDASYHHGFGLETAWRGQADAWGYPLTDEEFVVDYRGEEVKGRVFSQAGLVVWVPEAGAEIVGWPA